VVTTESAQREWQINFAKSALVTNLNLDVGELEKNKKNKKDRTGRRVRGVNFFGEQPRIKRRGMAKSKANVNGGFIWGMVKESPRSRWSTSGMHVIANAELKK